MAKKIMKGVIARMFTLVSERMRVHEAIQELIDNSIDANAKNINIELNSKESTFLCTDDGCGMNGEQMEEYCYTMEEMLGSLEEYESELEEIIGG